MMRAQTRALAQRAVVLLPHFEDGQWKDSLCNARALKKKKKRRKCRSSFLLSFCQPSGFLFFLL
jgi:hypothetical protein